MSYTLDDESALELKIRNRRRVMFIQICMFLLIVIVEGGINYMLYATRSQGYGPETIREKLIRYWGITTAVNAGAIILGIVFQKIASSRPKFEFLENYALMFPIIVICTNVAYSHYQFAGTFGVFVLAITITTIFEDVYLTFISTIFCVGGLLSAVIARACDVVYKTDAIPEGIISLCFIIIFGFVAGDIIKNTKKKKIMLEDALDLAEHASKAKSDFLANMSHEIRTPMNSIVGMCELILREPDITPSITDYCFNIQSSGRNLLAIINDILDFSKIESGMMEIIESEFNIGSVLNDVINMAVTRKGNKKLEIIVLVDPEIPVGLIGDEMRIKQIMVNLMTNSIKYTPEGAVTLRITQSRQSYGINLNVSVEDTGIGIHKEDLEKLFTSFQQVDTKKNRAVEGTGLGLAICKRLVTKMGGFINVRSEYGKGSTFSFTLPIKVSNNDPFIVVKDSDNIRAVGYIGLKNRYTDNITNMYKELIGSIKKDLHINTRFFMDFEDIRDVLDRDIDNITHIFLGKDEYLEHKDYFNSLVDRAQVVIIQELANPIELLPQMKCIYKPFYALSLASIFNNDNKALNLSERRGANITFSAPTARVLLVDDNEINLKVAVGLMRPYNMQVITVNNAKSAINMLRSKDFDLVLMDHMMPEMDGVEATQFIRGMEGEYYRNLPIIALTANALNGAREMFLQNGFNDFLAKPIEIGSMDRILRAWLPKEKLCKPVELVRNNGKRKSDINSSMFAVNNLFNVETGLTYTGGDMNAYQDILQMYVKKAPDKIKHIGDLFEAKDWKDYVIEVHALKSSSLSIGARELSEFAKKLELAGKGNDYDTIIKENADLLKLYGDVADAGKAYLIEQEVWEEPEVKAEGSAELKPEILKEGLMEMVDKAIEACANYDVDEIESVVNAASEYSYDGRNLTEMFEKVKAAADDFEYEQAKELLEKIKNEVE
ncbi:MAG: response regulator [Lachnospiraceae bacterium]|nr:response regulator [Lachnospiraceae bacterium]